MYSDDTRGKLENITGGIVIEGATDHCTAIRNLLCSGFSTSTTVKRDFESKSIAKEKQAEFLIRHTAETNLLIERLPDEYKYLTRGGESKVYFDANNNSIIKVNDAVYYATWLEFFNSLTIHNILFPNTTYSFKGLFVSDSIVQVVLEQPFIVSDNAVDLCDVNKLLAYNGFENSYRRGQPTNNYYNRELGLILEDIHDENVIVNSDTLFLYCFSRSVTAANTEKIFVV